MGDPSMQISSEEKKKWVAKVLKNALLETAKDMEEALIAERAFGTEKAMACLAFSSETYEGMVTLKDATPGEQKLADFLMTRMVRCFLKNYVLYCREAGWDQPDIKVGPVKVNKVATGLVPYAEKVYFSFVKNGLHMGWNGAR